MNIIWSPGNRIHIMGILILLNWYIDVYVIMNLGDEIESHINVNCFVDVWTLSCPCMSNIPLFKFSKNDVILFSLCTISCFLHPQKWNVFYCITEIGTQKLRCHAPLTMDTIRERTIFDALFSVYVYLAFCILYMCKSMVIKIFSLALSLSLSFIWRRHPRNMSIQNLGLHSPSLEAVRFILRHFKSFVNLIVTSAAALRRCLPIIITFHLAASRLHEIWRLDVPPLSE